MVESTGAATLEDVARAAGVSRATVSRVVRGEPGVSQKKAAVVQAAVDQLHYIPNRAARSLVTRRTDTIALIVPEPDQRIFSDPFFAQTVQAISSSLEDSDIQLVMAFADHAGSQQRLRPFLHDGHVDGAIVVSHHQIPGQIETFMRAPIPIVFIGRPAQSTSSLAWVDVDNREGGRLAARRMIESGVTRPAIITGTLDMVAAQDRLEGFRSELSAHDLEPVIVKGAFTSESGAVAGLELLPMIRSGRVDGVFASSDLMALSAMDVWRAEGVRVPEDVRVISFDDLDIAARTTPSLTSVTNPADQLAVVATKMLRDRLDGADTDQPVLLRTRLIVRASG